MLVSFDEITMDPTGKYIRSGPFARKELRATTSPVPVYLDGKLFLVIPQGFESDGMSFPWWQATWDDPWHYRYIAAALLHDYLLTLDMDKHYADWLFEGALLSFGVPALEIWIFKNAVRTKK